MEVSVVHRNGQRLSTLTLDLEIGVTPGIGGESCG